MATTQEILDESTKVAQEAAKSIGGTFTQGVGFQPDKISGVDLESVTTPDFQPEPEIPIFPVSSLGITQLEETPTERQAQSESNQLQDLNKMLLGESSFRASAEEEAGIAGLTQTQRDLQTQMANLIRESQAIPLQLQQESIGRGRTVGGIKPLQTGRLRENAIQALTTSSLLEASRGNLTTALDLVDRAVAQRYDPIKEQIAVSRANLDIILESPAYTREEKNRANAQKASQDTQQVAIERAEKDEAALKTFLAQAVSLGLPSEVITNLQDFESYEEAFSYAMPFMAERARTDVKAQQALQQLQADNIRSQIQARKDDLVLKAQALANKTVEEAVGEQAVLKQDAERAVGIQTLINDLKVHPKLKLATGFTSIFPTLPGFKTRDFNRTHDQLKDTLTKDGLKALRGLGAMSERELALIEKSVSKLALDLTEQEYVAELDKISENLQGTFEKAIASGVLDPIDVAASMGFSGSDFSDLSNSGLFDTAGSTSVFNPSEFYK